VRAATSSSGLAALLNVIAVLLCLFSILIDLASGAQAIVDGARSALRFLNSRAERRHVTHIENINQRPRA
jgi:hypothetical protein